MKWIRSVFSNIWKLYVGLIFCLTAVLLYPFFYLLLLLPNGKRSSFRLFVFWSRLFQCLCLYAVRKSGPKIELNQPTILVANHTSYLDIFLMFAHFPKHPFLFMGKSEILGYPILRTYFKNLNIPVDRKNKRQSTHAFYQAKKVLEEGFSVVIFPEGGIPDWRPPKMAPFKNGAFRLAKLTGCRILPFSFLNHYLLFSDPSHLLGHARPGVSRIQLFDPIYVNDNLLEVKQKCFDLIQDSLPKT